MGRIPDLPCDIEQVVELLGIEVIRDTGTQLHCRCPFCADRKAHMNVKIRDNVFRCNRCGKGGGILHLYAEYEDMKEGLISKTDFCDIRGQYDVRIADALIAQEQIDRELSIYLSGEQSPNNWMKTFTEHRGLKSLTRAVVLECIEKVVIHKDEKLEIIFEHSEDYARLVSSLQEYAERGILEEAM